MDGAAREDGVLTLQQWRKRFPDGRVPFEQALDVIRQLQTALHAVHFESPFHRDIVPSTVEVVAQGDGGTTFTVPDLAMVAENHGEPGARRYLAPEQWWGGRQNTYTDQYALAVLFVELVTGEVPFEHAFETDDEAVMKTAVCNHAPKLPSDCPRREVLLRALSKDPRARFHSCSSFAAALGVVTDSRHAPAEQHPSEPATQSAEHRSHAGRHGGHAHRASHERPRSSSSRRHPLKMLLLFLCLGGVVWWGVKSGRLEELGRKLGYSPEAARAKRAEAAQKAREEEQAAAETARRAQLDQLGEELVRQKAASEEALRQLQDFLEKGGPAVLTVRLEALGQKARETRQELEVLRGDIDAARKLERVLTDLRTGARTLDGVANELPRDSAVWHASTNLLAEAGLLQSLTEQFTEKHPRVAMQRTRVSAARRSLTALVDSLRGQVQKTLRDRESRSFDLQGELASNDVVKAALDRDLQIAKLKQTELERINERESKLLVDLRLREHALRFGSETSVTNAAGRR